MVGIIFSSSFLWYYINGSRLHITLIKFNSRTSYVAWIMHIGETVKSLFFLNMTKKPIHVSVKKAIILMCVSFMIGIVKLESVKWSINEKQIFDKYQYVMGIWIVVDLLDTVLDASRCWPIMIIADWLRGRREDWL